MSSDRQSYLLWKILDDIDTLDDACKGDDALFRRSCYAMQRRRFDIMTGEEYDAFRQITQGDPQMNEVEVIEERSVVASSINQVAD